MKRVEFSVAEMKILTELPGALEALADYHSYQETAAEASDFNDCAKYHEIRRNELLNAAAYIRNRWEDGEYPTFDGEQNA
jgi:hypothetical protein